MEQRAEHRPLAPWVSSEASLLDVRVQRWSQCTWLFLAVERRRLVSSVLVRPKLLRQ